MGIWMLNIKMWVFIFVVYLIEEFGEYKIFLMLMKELIEDN